MSNTREETTRRLELIDDILMSSMEKSYEMLRQVDELHAEQNNLLIQQLGLGLLLNFPEARTLRLRVDDDELSAEALLDENGSVVLEGGVLGGFVILEGSVNVDLTFELMSSHNDADWIYSVTAEPDVFDEPHSPIYLEHMEGTFTIDILKAANLMDIA